MKNQEEGEYLGKEVGMGEVLGREVAGTLVPLEVRGQGWVHFGRVLCTCGKRSLGIPGPPYKEIDGSLSREKIGFEPLWHHFHLESPGHDVSSSDNH